MTSRKDISVAVVICLYNASMCFFVIFTEGNPTNSTPVVTQLVDKLDGDRGTSWAEYVDESMTELSHCHQWYEDIPREWCNNYISTIHRMMVNLVNQMSSQAQQIKQCRFVPDQELRYLFDGPYGSLEYNGACNIEWYITVHPAFSLNISVLAYDPVLLAPGCSQYYYVSDWRNWFRTVSGFNFVYRSINKENNLDTTPLCGKIIPTHVLNSGSSIKFQMPVVLGPFPVTIRIIYHIMRKLPEVALQKVKQHGRIFSSSNTKGMIIFQTYDTNKPGYYFSRFKRFFLNLIFDQTSVAFINVHTFWMWQLHLNITKIDIEQNDEFDIAFVDGYTQPWDSIIHAHTHFVGITSNSSTENFTSTLSEATLVVKYSNVRHLSFSVMYNSTRISCVPNICHENTTTIGKDATYTAEVISTTTQIYNLTYSTESLHSATSISLIITSLDVRGYYTYLCDYGGLLLMYKEGTQPYLPLGLYCSQGVITGILRAAKPLYLGSGSLSIIIKNYGPLNSIHLRYTVFDSECRGIVSGHFYLGHSLMNVQKIKVSL